MPKWLRVFFALVVVVAGTNLPILLVSASPFQPHEMTYYPVGTMSMGITVTINVNFGGPMTPINLTAQSSGNDIILNWLSGGGSTTGYRVVKGLNNYPATVTDGITVYTGALLTYTDVGANAESSNVYYSVFGTNGAQTSGAANVTAGGLSMTLLALLALIAVLSFVAIKSDFVLLKIASMGGWFFLFMYVKDNPPNPLVVGSPAQQVLMIVCIAAGLGMGLTAFGRNMNRSRNTPEYGGVSGTQWGWKFGKDKDAFEGRRQSHEETLDEYQSRVRRALHRE